MEALLSPEITTLLELLWESVPWGTRDFYLSVIQEKRNNCFEAKVRKLETRGEKQN